MTRSATNPYRKMMFDLDDFAQAGLKKALEPDDVATVVLRAATEARPRSRYYAPFSARLQASLLGAPASKFSSRIPLFSRPAIAPMSSWP